MEPLLKALREGRIAVVDLSHELYTGMPTYPGDPPFKHAYLSIAAKYGEVTLSRIEMGIHSGTHLDLPAHFVPGGAITAEDLERFGDRISGGRAVLLYTGFSSKWDAEEFLYNWPYLSRDAADYLADAGVSVVGTEALSIAGYAGAPGYPYPARVRREDVVYVHHKLLSNGVLIIEGLTNLDLVLRIIKTASPCSYSRR